MKSVCVGIFGNKRGWLPWCTTFYVSIREGGCFYAVSVTSLFHYAELQFARWQKEIPPYVIISKLTTFYYWQNQKMAVTETVFRLILIMFPVAMLAERDVKPEGNLTNRVYS